MDEQLHFGQDKNGRSLWHSNRDGTLWNGWHYSGIDPMELIAELESTIADLRAHYCPPQPPSASDERERFEAWVSAIGQPHRLARDQRHGWYLNLIIGAWWRAWQARAALAPSPGVDAAGQKPGTVARVQNDIADFIADNWPMRKHTLAEIEAGIRAIEIRVPPVAAPSPAASADEWMAEAERRVDAYAQVIANASDSDKCRERLAALLAHLKARP